MYQPKYPFKINIPCHVVKVHFEDGNTITTRINGDKKVIESYYLEGDFNFGDTDSCPKDNLQKAVKVEFFPVSNFCEHCNKELKPCEIRQGFYYQCDCTA